jgi:hypothetical protein
MTLVGKLLLLLFLALIATGFVAALFAFVQDWLRRCEAVSDRSPVPLRCVRRSRGHHEHWSDWFVHDGELVRLQWTGSGGLEAGMLHRRRNTGWWRSILRSGDDFHGTGVIEILKPIRTKSGMPFRFKDWRWSWQTPLAGQILLPTGEWSKTMHWRRHGQCYYPPLPGSELPESLDALRMGDRQDLENGEPHADWLKRTDIPLGMDRRGQIDWAR